MSTWQRDRARQIRNARLMKILPVIIGLSIGGFVVFARFHEAMKKEEADQAASARLQADEDRWKKEREEREANATALDAKFAPVIARANGTNRGNVDLAKGRKLVGVLDGKLFKPELQTAKTPEEVGLVVFVKKTVHTERAVHYTDKTTGKEARIPLYPATFEFSAVALPENVVVASWKVEQQPQKEIDIHTDQNGVIGGNLSLPDVYLDSSWKRDIDALSRGVVPGT